VICLVEWPERGEGILPQADIALTLDYVDSGRLASLKPLSAKAAGIMARLACGRDLHK